MCVLRLIWLCVGYRFNICCSWRCQRLIFPWCLASFLALRCENLVGVFEVKPTQGKRSLTMIPRSFSLSLKLFHIQLPAALLKIASDLFLSVSVPGHRISVWLDFPVSSDFRVKICPVPSIYWCFQDKSLLPEGVSPLSPPPALVQCCIIMKVLHGKCLPLQNCSDSSASAFPSVPSSFCDLFLP